ncbi:MAG: dUTP diphosphatase [Candidatus Nanopelagicales bacterium]|nr:dUTP diphosphatase [Candidatus Nanopelagicales bacterium]MCF8537504.1 dUTP diphosphatase [Candidatus Nanopelagicales bacterium]MCF8542328.1 dUTP diphosphatase [Candidatus Nanopelagicales bacterium]
MSGSPDRVDVLVTMIDPDLPVPAYEHPGDAGLDLRSRESLRLGPGQRAMVPTGVTLALPPGYVALVCPRSGLAARHGIGLVNAPGVIDAGYRGEISVVIINHDPATDYEIQRGDRIAQLLVQPVSMAALVPVERLPGSHRGSGGFGSTGS